MKIENDDKEFENLQQRIHNPDYSKHILYMDQGNRVIGWFERVVQVIHTYGIKTVCFTFLIIASFIALVLFANAIDKHQVIEKWLIGQEEEHVIGTNIRKEINPKVTSAMVKLLYKMNADRVSVLEMHNGKENPTSLPFNYCDMTYEEPKEGIPYISEEYSDLNMSKYSFPSYIYKHRYFIGTVDEVYKIDKKLAIRLKANDVLFCGVILLRTNIDIGFLMISFHEQPDMSETLLLAELTYYAQEISSYLDYAKQRE